MLQQTQASRVAPKFETFIERFPTPAVLARAPLSEVLRYWSGLGYNRRAKFLWLAARCIVTECGGSVPASLEKLKALPGIGSYSAAAILAFAYDKPATVFETNIRSVFLHHFFPRQEMISDRRIMPLVEETMDRRHPRRWFTALMDYGAALKHVGENPGKRSAHYTKQSPFEESDRKIRGDIIKLLLTQKSMTRRALLISVSKNEKRTERLVRALISEELVRSRGNELTLPLH